MGFGCQRGVRNELLDETVDVSGDEEVHTSTCQVEVFEGFEIEELEKVNEDIVRPFGQGY